MELEGRTCKTVVLMGGREVVAAGVVASDGRRGSERLKNACIRQGDIGGAW